MVDLDFRVYSKKKALLAALGLCTISLVFWIVLGIVFFSESVVSNITVGNGFGDFIATLFIVTLFGCYTFKFLRILLLGFLELRRHPYLVYTLGMNEIVDNRSNKQMRWDEIKAIGVYGKQEGIILFSTEKFKSIAIERWGIEKHDFDAALKVLYARVPRKVAVGARDILLK